MLPYYTLIGMPVLVAIFYELVHGRYGWIREKKNYTILMFFLIYFILLAFRSNNVGVDTSRYFDIYNIIANQNMGEIFFIFEDSEKGYLVLNKFISIFFKNEQWLLIVCALICIVPIANLYYKESKNALVSMALFLVMPVFQMNFSGLRQAIAIACVAPALYAIRERKFIKFLIIVGIAMLFHSSAFILLIMYPAYYINLKAKHIFALIPIGVCVIVFNSSIYLFLLGFMNDSFGESYSEISSTGAYTMLIVYVFFTIYAFFFTDENKMDERSLRLRNYMVVATFLQMFAPVNIIAMRLNYYFIIFIPIIITQATYYCKPFLRKYRKLIEIAIFMVFTVYFVDKANSVDSLGIYPYEFFFNT